MAKCNIIREGNQVVYTEAPNGNRSQLFDSLAGKLQDKNEALRFWLASKTEKFLNTVTHPTLTKYRQGMLTTLNAIKPTDSKITLNIDGKPVKVDLKDLQFTNVKRVGFSTISAFVSPSGAITSIPKEGAQITISPENEAELIKINKYIFDLNNEKAISAATLMDAMIGNMAKRAGIPKSQMYGSIGFGRTTKAALEGQAALFQGFKSTAKEGISKIPEGTKLTPNKWIQQIVSKGGKGTAEELKWLDLKGFLDDYVKSNKVKSVPKSAVKSYLEANKLEIEEVHKGDTKMILASERAEAVDAMINGYLVVDNQGNEYGELDEDAAEATIDAIPDLYFPLYTTAPGTQPGKFKGFTLPHGVQYREFLLTFPRERMTIAGEEDYVKTSHWDEKNVLAHFRVTTREDSENNSVLFIEEVQSDWGQEGREDGFLPVVTPTVEKNKKLYNDLSLKIGEQNGKIKNKLTSEFLEIKNSGYRVLTNKRDKSNKLFKPLNELGLPMTEIGNYKVYENDAGEFFIGINGVPKFGMLYNTRELAEESFIKKAISESWDREMISDDSSVPENVLKAIETIRAEYKKLWDLLEERDNVDTKGLEIVKLSTIYGSMARFDESEWGIMKVPGMPYQETKQWAGLAIRRIMQLAVEEGFQKVAWTTGEQQADRFSLSEYYSSIEVRYNPTVNDEGHGPYELVMTDLDGEIQDDSHTLSEKELADYVGTALAKQMIQDAKTSYEARQEEQAKRLEEIQPQLDEFDGNVSYQREFVAKYQKMIKELDKEIDSLTEELNKIQKEGLPETNEEREKLANRIADLREEIQSKKNKRGGAVIVHTGAKRDLHNLELERREFIRGNEITEYVSNTYEGDNLRVGGYGMLNFYNKMLPDIVQSTLKRFDNSIKLQVFEIPLRGEDTSISFRNVSTALQTAVHKFYKGEETLEEISLLANSEGLRIEIGEYDTVEFYDNNLKPRFSKQLGFRLTEKARMNLNQAVPLFQDAHGAMVASDSKFTIYAMTNPNVTTPLHELTHVYEHYMTEEERAAALAWAGKEVWDVEMSETFARGFEKYLAEGKAPTPELQSIFDNFRRWLLDIYNNLVGSEIDIELNDAMRLVYANMLVGDSVVAYRGEGNNYGPGVNQGLHWVALDKAVAEDYAGRDKDGKLMVGSQAITKPTKPFKLLYKLNTYVTTDNMVQHFKAALGREVKAKTVNENQWRSINKKIELYKQVAGSEMEAYHSKISKPEVSRLVADILSGLGYDAVEITEKGQTTYGLIKQNKDDKARKSRIQDSIRKQGVDEGTAFGKGSTSPQGLRLVEGRIESEGEIVYYQGAPYVVTGIKDSKITISDGYTDTIVDNSKLLVEVTPEVEAVTEFSLEEKNPDNLNNEILQDEVFNNFRQKNLEPSNDEVIGTAAYVKYSMDGTITAKEAIDKAVDKFQKKGNSPIHNYVNKAAKGSKVTTPNSSYNEAVRNNSTQEGDNLWVRNDSADSNEGRVLLVQFASSFLYGKEKFNRSLNSQYFDALYRNIPGYNRTSDFWEVPLWMASMAGMEANSDVYVIRDAAEAQKFLKEAKYDRVLFSALDVNEKHIEKLATELPKQEFAIGGYTTFENLAKLDNVNTFSSVDTYADSYGKQNKGEYSYRHFKGTQTIPRLKMSEGCTYKCAFCTIPKKVIAVPDAEIAKTVESLKDLDANLVYLDDKTFGQAKNFRSLPKIYKQLKEYNPNFEGFIIQTTSVDFADKKKFSNEFLKESGIKYVELGIETYNDDVLTNLKKKHSHRRFTDAAMANIRENGLKAIPNIVVGLSWNENGVIKTENEETYNNTYQFLEVNRDIISHLNVYSLAIYEGTELGDSIDVKEEADKNENIITKSWQKNQQIHLDAMDKFSKFALEQVEGRVPEAELSQVDKAPIKLGRLRYKETETEIEVDSSLLSPVIRETGVGKADTKGLGIGSAIYAELFKIGMQKGKKVVSSTNLSPASKGLWNKMVSIGVATKVEGRYELNMNPKEFDSNGEPSMGQVINFVEQQGLSGTLTDIEVVELRESMIGLPVESSVELFRKLKGGFFTEGYFKPTRESLTNSGLYSSEEITDILTSEELQQQIKEFIYKLGTLDMTVLNDMYADDTYLVVEDGSKNAIGKFKLANPYTIEQIAIERLGGIQTREAFEQTLYSDPALEALQDAYAESKYTDNDIFYRLSTFRQVAEVKIEDGKLVSKRSGTKEKLGATLKQLEDPYLIESIDVLLESDNTSLEEMPDVTTVLFKDISKRLIEHGIDATQLPLFAEIKPIEETKLYLEAVSRLLRLENDTTFSNFVEVSDAYFDINNDFSYRQAKLDNSVPRDNVFYLESYGPKVGLFANHALVPVGKNTYKRVSTEQSLEGIYEFMYQDMMRAEYPTVIPSRAFESSSYDEDGTINLGEFLSPANKENVIADLDAFIRSKAKEVYVGNEKIDPDTLAKYVVIYNFYNRSSNMNKFDQAPDIQREYSNYTTEISNIEYLKLEFVPDFNVKMLKEKAKDSKIYKDFYSQFEINEHGIFLKSMDPITLNKIKPYLAKNKDLVNYFRLKKQGFTLGVSPTIEPILDDVFLRNFYVNYPTAIRAYKGSYRSLNDTDILVPIKEGFIRVDGAVYEMVNALGKMGVYVKLETNDTNFKEYDMNRERPKVSADLRRVKVADTEVSTEIKKTNLYNANEAKKIDDQHDNC